MKKTLWLLAALCLAVCFSVNLTAENIAAPVSYGLEIIAAEHGMAKSGLVGETLIFSEDDFCRALNLSQIEKIKITSLPDSSEGRLLLGTTAVSVGQTVTRQNLALLAFAPSTKAESVSAFRFMVGELGYELECSVYMLKRPNVSPVAAHPKDYSLKVSAYSGGSTVGKLAGYDPEGDEIRFEIVKYPEHGLLILNDSEYTFYPETGYRGKDGFTYVVRDQYGNYSAASRVELDIIRPSANTVYSDMTGNYAKNAAIALAEKGIMSGRESGGERLFEPEGNVTREDFLVMVMKAAGLDSLPNVNKTVFADDADISPDAKPYIAAAEQLGYVSLNDDLRFYPLEKITRGEAALIVERVIGAGAIVGDASVRPVFNDTSAVPVSVRTALSNLHLLGMIDGRNGSINAESKLTRADAAVMLAGVICIA